MSDHNPQTPSFNSLSIDLTESILSLLPIPSQVRASSVCKLWNSIISTPFFPSPHSPPPWFFLFGLHNTSSIHNQSFAFDPQSDSWLCLPSSSSLHLLGSDGFVFTTTPRFSYSRILNPSWRFTSPLRFSRINPLLGVFRDGDGPFRFIVVGGVRFVGGLVDIEDRLAVEIYDPDSDSWTLCPPLPADFRSGNNSCQTLSSALFKGKCYVFGIYSCFVASFDLKLHVWSDVQTLRPPGVVFSFLIACKETIVLAGLLCNSPRRASFTLWRIDENTMDFHEISVMPHGLLDGLVDSEDDDKYASLKCVGSGNLVYVFNEEYHKTFPACVCEINEVNGKCSWRRLPPLPIPVNKFHQVVSFCSTMSIRDLVTPEEVEEEEEEEEEEHLLMHD